MSFYITDCDSLLNPLPINKNITEHKNWKMLPKNCGTLRAKSRITGGKTAALGQFPWLARLGYNRDKTIKFLCGSALIRMNCILTAAHCIKGHETEL